MSETMTEKTLKEIRALLILKLSVLHTEEKEMEDQIYADNK